METEEYQNVFDQEKKHWYYVGLRRLIFKFLEKINSDTTEIRALDAGCGTGGLLEELKGYSISYGFDISKEAIKYCKLRKLENVVRGSVENIPFAENTFNVVISLDVLYHLQVQNDLLAIKELYRILHDRGILIINIAAYNFLRSAHDDVVHTRHRYTKKELEKKLCEAGFRIVKLTYRNSILFPVILIKRIFENLKNKKSISDVKPLPRIINFLLIKVLALENILLQILNFPVGLSIFCIAQKRK